MQDFEKNDIYNKKTIEEKRDIVTIDNLIYYYIKEKISTPFQNTVTGGNVTPTVVMANPERSYKEFENHLREKTGNKYNFPIIGIRNNGFDVKNEYPSWLGKENTSHLKKRVYDKNGIGRTVYIQRSIPVNVNYEIIMLCDNSYQRNNLVESFVYQKDRFWHNEKSYRILVKFDSFMNSDISDDVSTERILKSSTNLIAEGFLMPEYQFDNTELVRNTKNDIRDVKIDLSERVISI